MLTNWEVIIIQFEKKIDDDNGEELFCKWTLEELIQTLEDKRCKQGNNRVGHMENLQVALKDERCKHGNNKVGHMENLLEEKELGHECIFWIILLIH